MISYSVLKLFLGLFRARIMPNTGNWVLRGPEWERERRIHLDWSTYIWAIHIIVVQMHLKLSKYLIHVIIQILLILILAPIRNAKSISSDLYISTAPWVWFQVSGELNKITWSKAGFHRAQTTACMHRTQTKPKLYFCHCQPETYSVWSLRYQDWNL